MEKAYQTCKFLIFGKQRKRKWRRCFLWNMRLRLWVPTPQNGQTHSNNSSAAADELFECVWPFVGLVLKGLKCIFRTLSNSQDGVFCENI